MILPLADWPPAGPFAPPRPSMRGQYLIRNPWKQRAVAALDALLSLIPIKASSGTSDPARILVANWAHLGDVTTSIGPLAALRRRYPDAHLGMLVGSWGRPAIAHTGLVDSIHVVDHWMLNRSGMSRGAKLARYRETRRTALREIKAIQYQVAIDLFAFVPPAHPLFFAAGVPVRIGYTSSGFGPLLTRPVRWSDEERPMADQYRDLIDEIDPSRPFTPAEMRPRRSRSSLAALPDPVATAGRYVVIHPGAGSPTRHWGHERWRTVIERLQHERPDRAIVLTGAGAADTKLANALSAQVPRTVNMAGRASWEQFVAILAGADLVVCPDTATGHVAALFEVPSVVIFTGTNSPAKWAPYNDRLRVMVRPVLCAPCNRTGCAAMACFLDVPPDAVADAALDLLHNPVVA